jgi:UDP-N-acetylmuramate--alanine ligase
VHAMAKPGDFVVCLGAGSITQWAATLPGELAALQAGSGQTGGRQVGGGQTGSGRRVLGGER